MPSPQEAAQLTPRQIVEALDRDIVGQEHAKRMVAIALRNRIRRRRLSVEKAAEVTPKNILLIGPTGVGKTEIARRLASLAGAPFLKVEATKFTEVGYVGRDVESIIRDLMDTAVTLVRQERSAELRTQAESEAERRLLDLLMPGRGGSGGSQLRTTSVFPGKARDSSLFAPPAASHASEADGNIDGDSHGSDARTPQDRQRERLLTQLRDGQLEERQVELEVNVSPTLGMVGGGGMEEMGVDMRGVLERMLPRQTVRRSLSVREARTHLTAEVTDEMLDEDAIAREAVVRAQEEGIVFIDELDKIVGRRGSEGAGGPDVSREGVQRDILPIIEGSTVKTKYGLVKTDHILFIAAGAFSHSRPSDLIPELQGRFPLRSELRPLGVDDFERILTEPRSSLSGQYRDLLGTEGVELEFTPGAVKALARAAFEINSRTENIGARRLHTLMERVLEEIAFDAPDRVSGHVVVDEAFVGRRLDGLLEDEDLQRFIL